MDKVIKNTINAYSRLLEGLDITTKKELINQLSASLNKLEISKEKNFYNSFGAFPDNRSAEQIIEEIKSSRSFRQ